MKAFLWALAAAAAFGATSVYFWQQLTEERARADEVFEQNRKLNARILELQKARGEFTEGRFAGPGGGPFAQRAPAVPPPPEVDEAENEGKAARVWNGPGPDSSPAFRKMMRNQIRASNKRLYADIGERLGLSKEEASKLIDLLTDQQMRGFEHLNNLKDPNELRRSAESSNQRINNELTDLIGADKVQSLQQYQESLPSRQELDRLARQLEGADAALTADQSKQLLALMVEERARIPQPQYTQSASPEEFQEEYLAWQADYNERVAAQTRSVLSGEQLTAYNDYQQWQKEMNAQFSNRPGGLRQPRSAGGTILSFSVASPPGAIAPAPPANQKPQP